MPTAKGTIVGVPATNHFIATFKLELSGLVYKLVGQLSGPIGTGFPPTSSEATLTYDDVVQLTGSRMFTAMIGKEDKFTIALDNGVVVDGILSMGVPVPEVVVGRGTWNGGA